MTYDQKLERVLRRATAVFAEKGDASKREISFWASDRANRFER